MTTYKEIKGTQIEVVSSDPSNPVEGQVWYNSTDQAVKGQAVTTVGSWSTTTALNTGRNGISGAGANNSAVVGFGGQTPPSTYHTDTETWNGSNWTEVNNLNQGKKLTMSFGISTAAISAGGYLGDKTGNSETWNGTNWTEGNNLNQNRYNGAGVGLYTSGLVFGGYGPVATGKTETYDGTSYTEVNDLNTSRYGIRGSGTQTSALGFGGYTPGGQTAVTELWNGTNWTEVNDLNQARYNTAGEGSSNTTGLAFGGQPGTGPSATLTELWNGTNWSEQNDLNTGRVQLGSGGNSDTSVLAFGGEGPPATLTSTEEWTGAGAAVTRTFTDS